MGAKNSNAQDIDQIIENQNGQSRLHTGFIYNNSDYVVQYYLEKAYHKEKSTKPPTTYSQPHSSLHQQSQQQYSQEWDDWKGWQNSQQVRSKKSVKESQKNSNKTVSQKSHSSQSQEQKEQDFGLRCVLVSIPKKKMEIKGLDGILLGHSFMSICLRKQNQYFYLKKRQRIINFSDLFIVVNNDGCEKMKKDLINQYIKQVLPEYSAVKKIDYDELSNKSRTYRQQTASIKSKRLLF